MKAALPSLALQVDLLPNCQHLIPRLARLRFGRCLLDRSIVRVRWGCLQRRKHVVLNERRCGRFSLDASRCLLGFSLSVLPVLCACSAWLAISRLLASSFGMISRASMFETATVYLSAFLRSLHLSGEEGPVLSSPRSMFPSSLCYATGRAAVRF